MTYLNTRRWIYFPKGTYLVSGMIQGLSYGPNTTTTRGPSIIGENRTGTVIRLKDGTWPTDNFNLSSMGSVTSQVVLHGGDCGNTAFGKEMHNFTVDIGNNNDGATGVLFATANYGGISDVNVVSRDGKGCIGVALSGGEIGPAYARNISVSGFKVGIYSAAADDITLFQIRLQNQTRYGVLNAWGAEIDSMSFATSTANVPAVFNAGSGRLVVLNGFFSGTSSGAALVNQNGHLFARKIHSTGYQGGALSSTGGTVSAPSGAVLDEYASHGSQGLWNNSGRSMNMQIKYPPFPAWEQDTTKWTDLMRFKGGGLGNPTKPDTTAFRMAWTSGRPNIEINNGKAWNLSDTLFIEGDIERVVGTFGGIICPAVVIRNNTKPIVVVQFIDLLNSLGTDYSPLIINRSSKTVILQSVNGDLLCDGTGELFINSLLGRIIVRNPAQRVWVRDFNGESQPSAMQISHDSGLVTVENGQMFLMGYKSEDHWAKANCLGGFLEVFGVLAYNMITDQNEALFNIRGGDGQFSMAMLTQVTHQGDTWVNLVRETRDGQTRTLTRTTNPDGSNLTLYTGYSRVPAAERSSAKVPRLSDHFTMARINGTTLEVGISLSRTQPVGIRLMDMRGRAMRLPSADMTLGIGAHRRVYDLGGLSAGAYCVVVETADALHTQRVLLTRTGGGGNSVRRRWMRAL